MPDTRDPLVALLDGRQLVIRADTIEDVTSLDATALRTALTAATAQAGDGFPALATTVPHADVETFVIGDGRAQVWLETIPVGTVDIPDKETP